LLTILNEKKFRNGKNEINVPMKALISASNELPNKEQRRDQGLEALWDRFLVRLVVEGIPINERDNFEKMIKTSISSDVKVDNAITNKEYKKWSTEIEKIDIPQNVSDVIDNIRKKIVNHNKDHKENEEKQIYVSDRRWKKILRLMCTSAFLNSRNQIDLMDCFLIKDCIWNEDEEGHRIKVSSLVNEAIQDYGPSKPIDLRKETKKFQELKEKIEENTRVETDRNTKEYYDDGGNTYFKILKNFDDTYCFLKSKDVAGATYTKNVTIFAADNGSIDVTDGRNCYIKKPSEKNIITISSKEFAGYSEYEMDYEPAFRKDAKPPTRQMVDTWNKDINNFLSELTEKKEDVENFWEKSSEGFKDNLFTGNEKNYDTIKSKIDFGIKEILKMITDIECIRDTYQESYKKSQKRTEIQ
jgi:MoxR-like ATPase